MRRILVNGVYAYVAEFGAGGSSFVVYNTASTPTRLASIDIAGDITAMARSGTIVYLAAKPYGAPTTIYLIDVVSPQHPTVRGSYTLTTYNTVERIAPAGARIYLGGAQFYNASILDVSNPANPVFVKDFGPPGATLDVDGNRAIVGGEGVTQLFDITNPDSPQLIRAIAASGLSADLAGNFVYFGESLFAVGDITKPADQGNIATYKTPGQLSAIRVSSSRAYVLDTTQGLLIFDVNKPAAPRLIGTYAFAGVPTDLAIGDGRAYVVGGFGMQVLDVRAVAGVRALSGLAFSGAPISLATEARRVGNLAYVTQLLADGSGQTAGGLYIFDMSDPTAPALRGTYANLKRGNGLAVSGNIAFVADGSSLELIDVGNPAQPRRIGGVNLPPTNSGADAAGGVEIVGSRAYVTGGGVTIIDISNPSRPRRLGRAGDFARGIDVVGNLLYVASEAGFQIFDITNPAAPQLVDNNSLATGQAYAVDVVGTTAYIAAGELTIADVGNPAKPLKIASFNPQRSLVDVEVAGTTAYAAAEAGGIQLIDIAQPQQSRLLSAFDDTTPGKRLQLGEGQATLAGGDQAIFFDLTTVAPARSLSQIDRVANVASARIVNGIAYLAAASEGLQIFDLRNPANPRRIGSYRPQPNFSAVLLELSGNLLYLASYQRGIDVLDIGNPASPTLRGTVPTSVGQEAVGRMQVVDKRLYMNTQGSDVVIFDLSNPLMPQQVGSYGHPDRGAYDFQVIGSIGYVVLDFSSLHIVDLANPASPKLLKAVTLPDSPRTIAVRNGFAYIGVGFDGVVAIVDVARANPAVVGSVKLSSYVWSIQLTDTTAFFGDNNGLIVMDRRQPAAPKLRGTVALGASLLRIYLDGNLVYAFSADGSIHIYWYLPASSATIGAPGGTLSSPFDQTSYSFPANTFTATTVVTHTPRYLPNLAPAGALIGIGHAFELTFAGASPAQQLATGQPFQISVHYSEAERGAAIEASLALYLLVGQQWVRVANSSVNPSTNTITASSDAPGVYAVLGATRSIFAPLAR